MARPGVMFYFDIRPCIRRLNLADKGQLFEAILDYAENGVEPELDGALGVAWDFIQPRIDRDSAQYEQKTEKNRYATFTRELKKQGHDAITFDDWKALTDVERHQMISDDGLETSDGIERYPTTTTTTTSNIFSPELADREPDKLESKARTKKVFPPDSDAYMAACCLRDEIAARLPTSTPPGERQLQSWADAFDKCHRLDGHDWDEIERVLLFSQSDKFWQQNILSGGSFRKHYTSLLARLGGG